MYRVVVFVVLIVLNIKFSAQFPNGGPVGRCNNLLPGHQNFGSQESPSPYDIVPSTNIIGNGHNITVEIRSSEPGRTFAGFMLQARTTAETFVIVGVFQESPGPAFNFRDCSGYRTTVTNADNNRKESIIFEWEAPTEFTGSVRFQ